MYCPLISYGKPYETSASCMDKNCVFMGTEKCLIKEALELYILNQLIEKDIKEARIEALKHYEPVNLFDAFFNNKKGEKTND